MAEKLTIDAMWDDSPIDVSTEVNFIWSIANKLRGTYQSDKYQGCHHPDGHYPALRVCAGPDQEKGAGDLRRQSELSGKGYVPGIRIPVL